MWAGAIGAVAGTGSKVEEEEEEDGRERVIYNENARKAESFGHMEGFELHTRTFVTAARRLL